MNPNQRTKEYYTDPLTGKPNARKTAVNFSTVIKHATIRQ